MMRAPGGWVVAVWLWAGTAPGAEPSDERPRVVMSTNTQRVLSFPPEVRGFSVRDEGVLEVRFIGNRQLLLLGGPNEGLTELILHGPTGPVRRLEVRLLKRDACGGVICEPCRLLPRGHMLQMWGEDDIPVLRGIAWSLEEARAVRLLATSYPIVRIKVKLAGRALREGLLRVDHALWRAGFLHARARVVEGRVFLGGFASDADEARARAAIAPAIAELEEVLTLPLVEESAP